MTQAAAVPRSVPRSPSASEAWLDDGQSIVARRDSALWALGDHLLAPPEDMGPMVDADLAERLGATPGLLRTARWIARRFPEGKRRKGPRFGPSHHFEVAALPDDVALPLLDRALKESWTVVHLRLEARAAAAGLQAEQLAAARQRNALSADWSTEARHTERDLHKLAMDTAVTLRSMQAAVDTLAQHPGRGAAHGNRVRGVVDRVRAIFVAVEHAIGEFMADDHLAGLQRGATT